MFLQISSPEDVAVLSSVNSLLYLQPVWTDIGGVRYDIGASIYYIGPPI